MKIKIENLSLIVGAFLLTQQLMSCQKDNELSVNGINENSIDNSINTLPVDSSLVAWYPFRDGSFADKSGHGNRIVFCSATPVASRSGQDSGAYYFDGSSSYMKVRNSPSLNPAQSITMAALVKPMGFYQGKCHSNRILSKGYDDDHTNGRYSLGFDDMAFYDYTGCDKPVKENKENFYGAYGNSAAAATGITDTDYIRIDRWYTVVFTYDGSVSKLYINNELANTSKGSVLFTPTHYNLYIGRLQRPDFPYYFNGIIDEIRIYNRALSSDEVLGLNNVMGK
jgi:hypothetical protein